MKIKILGLLAMAGLILAAIVGCGSGTGNLKVSVIDSSGNAVWGAKVVSEAQPGGQLKITGITQQEQGGVVFDGIKSGNYSLQISCAGFAPQTLGVYVRGGQTENVTVTLYYASPPPVT
jgi:Carboxypeptidase regulatory-like domain